MALKTEGLAKASYSVINSGPAPVYTVWTAEAHGIAVCYISYDPEAEYWVSPIWNMRQKGVALVDSGGNMVKHERKDR